MVVSVNPDALDFFSFFLSLLNNVMRLRPTGGSSGASSCCSSSTTVALRFFAFFWCAVAWKTELIDAVAVSSSAFSIVTRPTVAIRPRVDEGVPGTVAAAAVVSAFTCTSGRYSEASTTARQMGRRFSVVPHISFRLSASRSRCHTVICPSLPWLGLQTQFV